jgi:hypothetical protein
MLYLVVSKAEMNRANQIDSGEGPGVTFKKIVERFHPQSVWGNPTIRQVVMVVDLKTPVEIAELMYALTWFTHGDPMFTPLMGPEVYDQAIAAAKKLGVPP